MTYFKYGFNRCWPRFRPSSRRFSDLPSKTFPERWLQQIWRHQRIDRQNLRTAEGHSIRILHPGFWNRGPGPDFAHALISFNGASPISGSVEIDLVPQGWLHHGHNRNPAFKNVILHVVWTGTPLLNSPPMLSLEGHLDSPLKTLGPWLDQQAPNLVPLLATGRCATRLKHLDPHSVHQLLHEAAQVRLQRKTEECTARAGLVGWDRTLWELIFSALGYHSNSWPMRCIAEHLQLDGTPRNSSASAWEARLLGVAGMLGPLPQNQASQHTTELWHDWWRERDSLAPSILPKTAWALAGIRPANHPQRRLALASGWLAEGNLQLHLHHWINDSLPDARASGRLWKTLNPGADPFWSHHWSISCTGFNEHRALLGKSRFTDLAMNCFLPWLHARALAEGNTVQADCAAKRYHLWPRGQDNAVLRLTRQRLAGSHQIQLPCSAAIQQGLLQIADAFCNRSDALCTDCSFPETVPV